MLLSARMHRVRAIVLKRDAEAVTEAIGRLGMLELTQAAQPDAPEQERAQREAERRRRVDRCGRLRESVGALMDMLQVARPQVEGQEGARRVPVEEVEKLAAGLQARVEPITRRLAALEEQRLQAQQTVDQLAPYRELSVAPQQLAATSFLSVLTGDMPDWQIPAARAALPQDAIVVPIGTSPAPAGKEGQDAYALRRVLALSSRRSRFAVETVLQEHQFKRGELPAEQSSAPAAIHDAALARVQELSAQVDAMRGPLAELGRELGAQLTQAYLAVSLDAQLAEAEESFGSTWATVIITGWCPSDRVEEVRQAVDRVTNGQAVFESHEATAEDIALGRVPSYSRQPGWLRPFSRLSLGMGQPNYREIEPTLLFAVSFLVLFGMIFGDVGHGLCLLAVGLIVRFKARTPTYRDLGYVVAAAGAASMLFGAFFEGTLFGASLHRMGWRFTLGLEPLNFHPGGDTSGAAESVLRYLVIALVAGVVLISAGVILNIINCLRSGEVADALLGRFGVVGIVFYWGALALAVKMAVGGGSGSDVWLAAGVLGVPLVLVALKEPIYALITHRRKLWEEAPAMGLFQGIVEAMETVMLYVANTFSFLRVAAFALSHAALCLTIFVVRDLVKGPAAILWTPLVFLVGTALIIGLEGLIVIVQVCRLEYYELFTKFFRGEGKRFSPFRLR